jgi:hypothetical protein
MGVNSLVTADDRQVDEFVVLLTRPQGCTYVTHCVDEVLELLSIKVLDLGRCGSCGDKRKEIGADDRYLPRYVDIG